MTTQLDLDTRRAPSLRTEQSASPEPGTAKPTIVLLYPRVEPEYPSRTRLLGLPLSVLTVARPLVRAGYDVRIIDEVAELRPMDRMREMPKPLWVGISNLGGYQCKSSIAIAKKVRKLWRDVPLVWGGWNPTLLPELYEDPKLAGLVDVLVRGRGEQIALDISRRLEKCESLDGLLGVSWRGEDGALVRNPDAPLDDPTEYDHLPYELIPDFRAYTTKQGILNYISSYGCPHRCAFCGIPAYTRTFRAIRNERVVEHLRRIRALGMKSVVMFDDNFFTSNERVVDLARRLIDGSVGIEWHCNGRLDQLLRLSIDEMRMLNESGLRSVNIGYETGDQAVAEGVDKGIDVGEIDELARRFRDAGIHLSLNFMVGLPGEAPESLARSLESLLRIYAIQPDMSVSWYMYMPAPGTPLWTRLAAEGRMTLPDDLQEHARLQTLYMEIPWFHIPNRGRIMRDGRNKHRAIVWYFYVGWAAAIPRGRVARFFFGWLRRWCRWRFERRHFRLRVDWLVAFETSRALHALERLKMSLIRIRPFHDVHRWRQRRWEKKQAKGKGVSIPWALESEHPRAG